MAIQSIHVVGFGGTLRTRSTSLWALEHALKAARTAGATTELLPLRDFELPFYRPGVTLHEYSSQVRDFIQRVDRADALLISSAAYPGTLAGVTKNAIDFLEFLGDSERPYLQDRVVGLIATAGGTMANVRTTDDMVHIIHSLRGTVAPLQVAIPQAGRVFGADGNIQVEKWAERLDILGRLVVETTQKQRQLKAAA